MDFLRLWVMVPPAPVKLNCRLRPARWPEMVSRNVKISCQVVDIQDAFCS
jgi:hypothetical protein